MKKVNWFYYLLVILLTCSLSVEAKAEILEVGVSGYLYTSIQEAINRAVSGNDLVLVHDGTYIENLDFKGKMIVVRSENGAAVTIIDGNANGSVVTFGSAEIGGNSVLEGFTVKNGNGTALIGDTLGGGIYCNNSSSAAISECIISGNTASNGGGVYCKDSSLSILNCIILGNTASNGGGIYSEYSSPNLVNCTIAGNTSSSNGGGIYLISSFPMGVITNCIFWGDTAGGNLNEIYLNGGSSIDIKYSDIYGGYAGTGNINTDPMFIDAANGNYHLQVGSPCIDTGRTNVTFTKNDIEGTSRPQGVRHDMGAYEL